MTSLTFLKWPRIIFDLQVKPQRSKHSTTSSFPPLDFLFLYLAKMKYKFKFNQNKKETLVYSNIQTPLL